MAKQSNTRTAVHFDGGTAYTEPNPAGLGVTVTEAMMDAARAGAELRHVVVCGPRPGGSARVFRAWVDTLGPWFANGEPHVTPDALRVTLSAEGRTIHVSRAATWFGEASPAVCVDAMRIMRHVAGLAGARASGTPGRTGLAMLRAIWERSGVDYAAQPAEVADLLRSTSGQGRFQVFPAAGEPHRRMVGVDARFQYAAIAGTELPTGVPELVVTDPDPYAPAWCHVRFTPCGGPIGLLGVMTEEARGWTYPTTGTHETWTSGAELHLARQHGYKVEMSCAYVWPSKVRPLASWANLLIRERERVAGLPITPEVVAAVRAGLRGMVIQAIGMMHGRPPARHCIAGTPAEIPAEASNIRRDGDRWRYDVPGEAPVSAVVHPEWSTAIWGAARARLARQLLAQRSPVLACALDGYYVAGDPVVEPDDGRAGRWRHSGQWANVPALANMSDLYRVTRG